MKNCTTCRYDNNGGQCQQGHIRWNMDHHWIVEDCHAWQEKEKPCECQNVPVWLPETLTKFFKVSLLCKKCGRVIE